MDSIWTGFLREVVDARYTLTDFVKSDGDSGVFLAETADGTRVRVRFLPEDSPAAMERVKGWSRAVSLRHPTLLTAIAEGDWDLDGKRYLYLVSENEDDQLSEVLRERALTVDEARPVLQSVLAGLAYLHGEGLSHGSIRPQSVLAVGDHVKLSNHMVTELPPAFADDRRVRAAEIGEIATFTRTILTGTDAQTATPLPSPFREVVRRSTEAGTTAQELLDTLNGKAVVAGQGARPVMTSETPRQKRSFPPAAALAGTAVAVIAGVWVAFSGSEPRKGIPPVEPAPVAATGPATQTEAKPSPVREPEAPKRIAQAEPAAAPALKGESTRGRRMERQAAAPQEGQNWGVVAATYRDFDAASQRARSLGRQWRSGSPKVFPAKGEGQRYYVVLGSGMSQPEARELLEKAQSSGMPRDAYVTKLNF